MTRAHRFAWASFALLLTFSALSARGEGEASEIIELGNLRLEDVWIRSAIGSRHAKLFFTFRNLGPDDRLIVVRSQHASGPTFFRTVRRGPSGREVRTAEAIPIPSTHRPYELSEVGHYVELTDLERPLVMGSQLPVRLEFEGAGSVTLDVTNRFHSPRLARRIREAIRANDVEKLRALQEGERPAR